MQCKGCGKEFKIHEVADQRGLEAWLSGVPNVHQRRLGRGEGVGTPAGGARVCLAGEPAR